MRYEPHLELDGDKDAFDARVEIELALEQPTDRIELHADQLAARSIELAIDDQRLEPKLATDEDHDRWILKLPEPVGPGQASLTIAYEGTIRQDMAGLYRSQDGEEACLVTQCEPSDARSVFPCFDEPAFKAPIAWRIRADEDATVLTNGTLARTREHGDGTATRVFAPTPPISTYLAAVAVGDFEATSAREHGDVAFRVWAMGEAQALGEHARDVAARLTAWYEDYFQQPYPYAKYDQLAVPSFSFGAMENVGLVVFRRSLLLLDRDRATWDEEKAVDRVVSHELAHMWFGNLVTMQWWDDLWLNEAFAEWIAHRAVDELFPEHQVWQAFGQRTDQALATDALDSTHAIYHPVQTPAEAMEMFDAITYGKGSAVMRMLEAYLGPEAFQAGLARYIEAFAEDNAHGSQLWDHLAQASDAPVAELMRAWITQPGHPCVDVHLVEEGPEHARIELTQQRHRARRSTSLQQATWPVPVVLRWADATGIHETRTLLESQRDELELATEGKLAWLVANADAGGFYRAHHSEELEARLREHARELTPAERWALLRDGFSLVKAGRRSIEEHLSLVEELATGRAHFGFVDDVLGHVRQLERLLEHHGDEAALEGLRAWVRGTFGPALEALGLQPGPGEDAARRHRRATLLLAVGGLGAEDEARQAACELAEAERDAPDEVDPDTAQAALRVAARHGDHERFTTYLDTYRQRRAADRPPQQVEAYLNCLPLFREAKSIQALLATIEEGQIPSQSIGPLLETMLAQPHAQGPALAHVDEHAQALLDRVGPAWIARIVEALGHVGPAHRDEARSFLAGEIGDVAPESTQRARERLAQAEELEQAGVVEALAAWARGHAPRSR